MITSVPGLLGETCSWSDTGLCDLMVNPAICDTLGLESVLLMTLSHFERPAALLEGITAPGRVKLVPETAQLLLCPA